MKKTLFLIVFAVFAAGNLFPYFPESIKKYNVKIALPSQPHLWEEATYIPVGSGIILDGYHILSARHCIFLNDTDMAKYLVAIVYDDDGAIREISGFSVVYTDEKRDMVCLKTEKRMPCPISLKLAPKKPKGGEEIYAIGNPLGEENVTSTGTVGKNTITLGDPELMLLHIELYNGNSGCGIFNKWGQLVGMFQLWYGPDDRGQYVATCLNILTIREFLKSAEEAEKTAK